MTDTTTKTVYVSKTNSSNYQIVPIPSDLDNYYSVSMTQDEISALTPYSTYDSDSSSWVSDTDKETTVIKKQRLAAYAAQSDHLYLNWQYSAQTGADTADDDKQAWLDAVAAVKAAYPLPDSDTSDDTTDTSDTDTDTTSTDDSSTESTDDSSDSSDTTTADSDSSSTSTDDTTSTDTTSTDTSSS